MKTSTIIFNVAAVLAIIGVFIALADLMRHKAKTFGVETQAPVAMPAAAVLPTPTREVS